MFAKISMLVKIFGSLNVYILKSLSVYKKFRDHGLIAKIFRDHWMVVKFFRDH